MSLKRARTALANAVFGRRLREVHFYFGSVSLRDIAGALTCTLTGQGTGEIELFERECAKLLGVADTVSFGSGRMALYAILEALNIKESDEVILPGFTCVVVPNAIRYRGAKPVFVDIDPDTWNLDVDKVRQAITPRTRAILVQHTFGVRADLKAIRELARPADIVVIEDSAHVLISHESGTADGQSSDASFFSFESSKPVTLGRGGIAFATEPAVQKRLREVQSQLPPRAVIEGIGEGIRLFILTLLHRPAIFRFGKFLVALLFRAGIFTPNITAEECRGLRPLAYPIRLTAFQARLGRRQLLRLAGIAAHRRHLTELYDRVLYGSGIRIQALTPHGANIRLRYSFLLPHPDHAVLRLARRQVELGRWFNSPVTPVCLDDAELPLTSYSPGMCPVAESIVRHCVNLPTDPAVSDNDATRAARAVLDCRDSLS